MGPGYGMAEGAVGLGPDRPNVAGRDERVRDRDYAVQLFIGTQGGPATPTVDGWLAYVLPVAAGVLHKNSVEATEYKVPILITENKVRDDGEGPGTKRGAPGNRIVYGPIKGEMEVFWVLDGVANPPKGALGAPRGSGPAVERIKPDGEVVDETAAPGYMKLLEGELLAASSSGGAGYGDPLERDPALVLADVRERYLGVERAAEVYGVVLDGDPDRPETLTLNSDATASRRRGD
jgi:N-methylhydantoinase B